MRIVAGMFVAAALTLGAGQVMAQAGPPRGYGTPGTERTNSLGFNDLLNSQALIGDPGAAHQLYSVSAGIARCMVNIGGSKIAELLGGPYTEDESYRNLARAMQQRYSACIRDGGSAPPMVVNYALAEALVLKESGPAPEDRASSVNVDEANAFQSLGTEPVTMDQIARCLAAYSPGLARKVVVSEANSAQETTALGELYAKSPECGLAAPPASVPSVFQRGSLAVALYHWTHREG